MHSSSKVTLLLVVGDDFRSGGLETRLQAGSETTISIIRVIIIDGQDMLYERNHVRDEKKSMPNKV